MTSTLSEWYALNPDVIRLWAFETDEPGEEDHIHVVVALRPAGDSDDVSPIWMAKCPTWQRELQELVGRRVVLDWADGETAVEPCTHDAERARICVASIAWRDCCVPTETINDTFVQSTDLAASGVMSARFQTRTRP